MDSSKTDREAWIERLQRIHVPVPDVKAWRLLVAAAAANDMVMEQEPGRALRYRYSTIEQVGERFFYTHLYPFCRKYMRKFDNMGWEPWKPRPRSRWPDDVELRKAITEVLQLYVQRRTHEGPFYSYVPTVNLGQYQYAGRVEASAATRLNGAKEPLYIKYDGTRYHVTAALDGVSMHLDPYTDDQTAYELAELVAYHPHLANYL